MADLFDVIADPTRRELLRALLEQADATEGTGESSVGELVAKLGLSQPTVSKHLKTLREFQVVTVREQGQHRYYRLEPERLQPLVEWLGAFVPPVLVESPAASDELLAVAGAAPERPLPPAARAVAMRIGAAAASVSSLLHR